MYYVSQQNSILLYTMYQQFYEKMGELRFVHKVVHENDVRGEFIREG